MLLKKFWDHLRIYEQVSDPKLKRQLLIEFCKDKSFVHLLREIAHNTLNKKFHIPEKELIKLRKHKNAIYNLTKKHKCSKKRRKVIVQAGNGFLPLVIPLLAQVIGSLIAK